jgi:hypothetical protein
MWGEMESGGDSSAARASLLSVVQVLGSATHAFAAALTSMGEVVAWGDSNCCGVIPSVCLAHRPLKNNGALVVWGRVRTLCANDVIKTNGDVVVWGHAVSVPIPGVQMTSTDFSAGAICA